MHERFGAFMEMAAWSNLPGIYGISRGYGDDTMGGRQFGIPFSGFVYRSLDLEFFFTAII